MKSPLYFIAVFLSLAAFHDAHSQEFTIDKHKFRFNGYTRIGMGSGEGGSTQANFQAPGAASKYRLGNEANNYLEYQLTYEYMLDREKDKSFELDYMGSAYSDYGKTNLFAINNINQLYVKMNNIHNNIDVWLGRRYYYRKFNQILDHWWLNANALGAVVTR